MFWSFLGYSLCVAKLLGWRRTGRLFVLTQAIVFICEYASTRIGIPYREYFYTGSTDYELNLSSIPFMDSLSFSSLLFGGDSLALIGVNPWEKGWANTDGYSIRD
jgi:uncharacterized membrane protein